MQVMLKACASREMPRDAGLPASCPADGSLYILYLTITDALWKCDVNFIG